MRTAIAAALTLVCAIACSQGNGVKKIDKNDPEQAIAYSIGNDIGQNITRQNTSLDVDAFIAGIRDSLTGNPPQLTKEESIQALQQFRARMMAKRQNQPAQQPSEDRATIAAQNKELGEKFLAMNKEQPGVKVTASGLQYKVEREGSGTPPGPNDTVQVHYRGTLVNGEEFDSSYSRGQPAQFQVGAVIKGWTEALQMMKPGSKYRLYIPSELAYGERGAGEKIGPNAVLQFEVELLSVVK